MNLHFEFYVKRNSTKHTFFGKIFDLYFGHFIMILGRVYKIRRVVPFEIIYILFNDNFDFD
jgi:hypothetical protein